MPKPKNRLLDAALTYAAAGVPVAPAYPVVPADGRGGLRRRRWVCGCGLLECATPGAHSMGTIRPTLSADRVMSVWSGAEPPGLLIGHSGVMDLWRLPRELGALGMRLLEAQRPALWPPLMQAPDGSWVACTLPLGGPAPTIEAYGLAVRRVGERELVPVPPSRHVHGRLHWLWVQRFPNTPLPEAGPTLSALAAAAERLHPWELPDVAPASMGTPRGAAAS